MVIIMYAVLGIAALTATIYLVFIKKNKEFIKFLAGAFLVSGGIQLYLAIAGVAIPLLGTDFTQTPAVGFTRAPIHLAFSALCIYFGFIRTRRI